MINSFRSAISFGLMTICMASIVSTVDASIVNVSTSASGSAQYAVQFTTGGAYTPTGPVTYSVMDSTAEVGSSSAIGYAKASIAHSAGANGISISPLARIDIFSNGPSYTDFTGTATTSGSLSFQVDATEYYYIFLNMPQPGSSYVLNHTTASYALTGLISGNPVTIQSGSWGGGPLPQVLLTAGIPYTFSAGASANFPNLPLSNRNLGSGGTVSLTLVPEPVFVGLIIPAGLLVSRRQRST